MLKEGCANNEAMHSLKHIPVPWRQREFVSHLCHVFFQCTYTELFVLRERSSVTSIHWNYGQCTVPKNLVAAQDFNRLYPNCAYTHIHTYTHTGPSAPEFPPPPTVFNLRVAFKAHLHLWVVVNECHVCLYLSPCSSYVSWYFSFKKSPQTNRNV